MNMQNLMAQAQRMQREIEKKKSEIEKQVFIGESEMATVSVNGKREVISIKIKNDIELEKDDLEILEDMIIIATNNAMKQVDKALNDAMGQYGGIFNGMF